MTNAKFIASEILTTTEVVGKFANYGGVAENQEGCYGAECDVVHRTDAKIETLLGNFRSGAITFPEARDQLTKIANDRALCDNKECVHLSTDMVEEAIITILNIIGDDDITSLTDHSHDHHHHDDDDDSSSSSHSSS